MSTIVRPHKKSTSSVEFEERTLELTWPWWVHPGWALLTLTGTMSIASVLIPDETYAMAWNVRKYIDTDSGQLLLIALLVTLIGVIFSSGLAARGGTGRVVMSPAQIAFLRRAYKLLFTLTVIGYVLFFAFGYLQGVTLADLLAVLQRDEVATYRLKGMVQTIPGLTTMTQFGPIAVVLGFLLNKIGYGNRNFLWLVALSCLRVVFYSERLALIEVLVPLILISAITVRRESRMVKLISLAPVMIAPLIWGVFAVSEYFRSWVFYQSTTALNFFDWVTLRLLGYYATSFNNSAIFMHAHEGVDAPPFYSVGVFWNAPILSSFIQHPGIEGLDAGAWWPYTLSLNSSPEFNNEGSFLMTIGEFGPVLGLIFWLGVGLILGAMFASLSKGSMVGLLAYSTLFIGVLELARLIYWTQGRAFPVLVTLIVIAFRYPRHAPRAQNAPSLPSTCHRT